MTPAVPSPSSAASLLRQAFDHEFAVAPRTVDVELDALLGIGIRGEPYAVRLSEVGALLSDRRIVPLPGPARELLGLTGVRGTVVPVYDLGALLGHPSVNETPRFLLIAGVEHPVGLSFERFDGYVQVPRSEISAASSEQARSHCREVATINGRPRAVVLVHSVLGTITERVAALRSTREP